MIVMILAVDVFVLFINIVIKKWNIRTFKYIFISFFIFDSTAITFV